MESNNKAFTYFDESFDTKEQLPRAFSVSFEEIAGADVPQVRVVLDDNQLGDIINDNSIENDFYRYHDIFHYSFATLLGWSPCARAMMKKKRKSDRIIDEVQDGARAAITEEAISLIVFNEAKRKDYFANSRSVSKTTLRIIKEMTENFEVHVRSEKDWELAILESYRIFRLLICNNGGKVLFDMNNKEISYQSAIN
ncbi:nucleotide pyrophosphohydrolase [Sphingobacterium corticibacter]|uniref:Nucleotide pyrophosphohydrolase n=1 Tax=Sphingobacterium corticibacter TaxID=2171749 RepID=A0A2T8HH11_9SPHI|nr:nucleotide pyrophosphohydrolase [Sphingobacterium corticibacter]PVH24727.1 nucleotide pyrophosphohydrolase [Sphingobacterium corticibacter]